MTPKEGSKTPNIAENIPFCLPTLPPEDSVKPPLSPQLFRHLNFEKIYPSICKRQNAMALIVARPWKPKSKRPTLSESMYLRAVCTEMEGQQGQSFFLPDLCKTHNVKRRALYDFISMMEKFGCCTRVTNEHFVWNGLKQATTAVSAIQKRCEDITCDEAVRQSLACDKNTSLPHIGEVIVTLFFYLHVSTLNIRDICSFLTRNTGKYETILRKVYTVSARLEVAGLISRTQNNAEIKLCTSTRARERKSLALADMINTKNELQMESVYAERRKAFAGDPPSSASSGGISGSVTAQPSPPDAGVTATA